MNFISPITIDSSLVTSSLAEDPTTAWASGAFAVGDERHVVAMHRVYKCAVAGTHTISPELDPINWVDMRPTNRMAPFDVYTSTAATSTAADITFAITARFCNALALYGMAGSDYAISVKDVSGGTVVYTRSGSLKTHALGWYAYLFGARTNVTRLLFKDIPIHPLAEVTITISAGSGATRSLGLVALGTYRQLYGAGSWGGTEYGASAEPVTYSYIKTDEDGTTTIARRHKATNLTCKIAMPRDQADQAVEALQSVLDVPCAWVATDIAGFSGLNTFGIASTGPVTYDSYATASINLNIKGLI